MLTFSLFLSLRVFVCFTLHSAEVAGHSLSHVPGRLVAARPVGAGSRSADASAHAESAGSAFCNKFI